MFDKFRKELLEFLESSVVQKILVALLLVDVLSVIVSQQLEIKYLDTKVQDLKGLISTTSNSTSENDFASSTSAIGLQDQICSCISEASVKAAGHAGLRRSEDVVKIISVAVLFIFLAESLLQLLARGPEKYFRDVGIVADAIIVIVSIALELSFSNESGLSIILVARIWRYIRLFKGGHDAQDKKKSRGRGKHRPGGAHPTMPVEMGESYVDDDMNVPFSATAAPDATEC
eukprot:m.116058 g.116058  ORF g.116058 m.116058 type:complete len:231 (-) comp17164_c0_seq8:228-920(-)